MVIVLLVSFVATSMAKVWTPDEVPVPRYQDRTQYVSNPEHILSQTAVDSINVILQQLEQTKGVQTLVAVLDKLEGDDPYDFAMKLARKHGVGDRKTSTGLVIVLATGDRSYQFLTGEGLEGTLPDGQIQLIEDRYFVPLLKQKDWDGAMLAAVKAINRVAQGDELLQKPTSSDEDNTALYFALAAVVAFALFVFIIVRSSQPRCPNCGQRKCKLMRQQQQRMLRGGRNVSVLVLTYRCKHCGHVFTREHFQDEHHDDSSGASFVAGAVLGSLLRGGRGSSGGFGGGGFGGGSFGGGSFGGGGSGGRF